MLALGFAVFSGCLVAGELDDMSLEQLLKQRAELYVDSDTASGVNEAVIDTPASLVVRTQEDFQRRGYDSLDDVLFGLPGFDTIRTGGTMETVAYQRGYRTPWTQRTLLLVNGKPDNNLWNHGAQISRQYPMSAIDRVEVLYGPAGSVYGPNAFLGVINVVTRDSSNLEDGETFFRASGALGNFDTHSIDFAFGGRLGLFSYDLGFTYFSSDEPDIGDLSNWGYADPAQLSDPDSWGAGIGAGVDPVTGIFSPAGDLDVDGELETSELVRGAAVGQYADPTEDFGLTGEVRFAGTTFGVLAWQTDEGYGPYYSFLDAQPNALWTHASRQYYIEREDTLLDGKGALESELVYRESRVGGDNWGESFGGFVSLSNWNSFNTSWRIQQRLNYEHSPDLTFNGGWKFERKKLNRAYLISNYWEGLGIPIGDSGVQAAEDISSESPTTKGESLEYDAIIPDNIGRTEDLGAFGQVIYELGDLRLNGGLRWDDNSQYGSKVSPRGAAIYHHSAETTFKLTYGEAFQEPSPKDLFGAFSGRASNTGLVPETVRSLEFISIFRHEHFQHELSLYKSDFKNAIATGQNVGSRDVFGFEYKNKFRLKNPLPDSGALSGELFYTYTRSMSDQQFDNGDGVWRDQRGEQGDVAPHKLNFNLNMPIGKKWNANISGLWVAERKLFSENPLRADSNSARAIDRKAEAYTIFDFNLLYQLGNYDFSFKIENLFEEDYLTPGVEGAGSGDDFSVDSDGFHNSLIPQLNTRRYTLRAGIKF